MSATRYGAVIRTSPIVREAISRDRDRGHVHVLSAFRSGLGQHPRKQLQLLWAISGRDQRLLVQADEPPVEPELLGAVERELVQPGLRLGDEYLLRLDRNCQKTPPSKVSAELHQQLKESIPEGKGRAYRSRLVVVPEDERPQWLRKQLAAHGFAAVDDGTDISAVRYAGLGARRRGIPYVSIRARVRVVDPAEAAKALREGVGRGKNYGLGLIRLERLNSDDAAE